MCKHTNRQKPLDKYPTGHYNVRGARTDPLALKVTSQKKGNLKMDEKHEGVGIKAKESQKNAKKKYIAKGKRFTVDFYPTELELIEHLNKQPKKQSFIKNLIRRDIAECKALQDIPLTTEDEIKIALLTAFMSDDKKEAFIIQYKKAKYK